MSGSERYGSGTPKCPRCGERAPIVLRGIDAFCTVCGKPRPTLDALSSTPLNFAGTPAKVGGIAAKVFGVGVLVSGLFTALLLGLVLQAIFPAFWLGYAVGIPIALLSLVVGGGALFGGWRLGQRGRQQVAAAQLETIRGMARHQRGVVKAREVAASLRISEAQADAILTDLAKTPEENVGVDLDENGELLYLFGSTAAIRWRIQAEQSLGADARRELEAELEAAADEEVQSARGSVLRR